MENTKRNRLVGYFGVAVTTLLTPGGKLFTSAMAAATVVGVAGVALLAKDSSTNTGKSSAPAIVQTSESFPDAELLALADIPASESGYDPLTATPASAPVANQPALSGFQSSASGGASTSATNVSAHTIPLSDSVPVVMSGGSGPQLLPGRDTSPVISDEPSGIPDASTLPDAQGPEIITEPFDKPTNPLDPEIIVAKAFPDSDPLKGPEVLPSSPPPRDDENNPLIAALAFPSIQALVPTAVSLPSTLALLLLGLANFGWIARRRVMQI